jgi:tetratricopeptide (TPR) repeat protein
MKKSIALLTLAVVGFAAELDRARQLVEERKFREAESELRAVVADQPDNAQAHYYLGLALLGLNREAEAEAALRRAIELKNDEAQFHLGLTRALIEQKRWDQARQSLNRARELDPNHKEIPYYEGLLKIAQRDFKGALRDLERAVERDPENAYAHYYLGMAYNATQRPDKMIEHFDLFLKYAPPDAPEIRKVQSVLKSVR